MFFTKREGRTSRSLPLVLIKLIKVYFDYLIIRLEVLCYNASFSNQHCWSTVSIQFVHKVWGNSNDCWIGREIHSMSLI